jgi:hypothetical protein
MAPQILTDSSTPTQSSTILLPTTLPTTLPVSSKSTSTQDASPMTQQPSGSTKGVGIAVGIAILVCLLVIALTVSIFCIRRRRQKKVVETKLPQGTSIPIFAFYEIILISLSDNTRGPVPPSKEKYYIGRVDSLQDDSESLKGFASKGAF